ncbi:MAG: bifunctional alpha,alpha-trehalose-phosphate synthase (UDP-forming)/trehalose-phosphatase [Brevinematales bacterium]|nr:bifunctional alpha,alpha-trehalose-phosphate synthase (UDP-forming)/trehalose-phosphatase [Brevinematales bacterium]
MKRIVMVSNRLPVKLSKTNNRININFSAGGLATGLSSFFESRPALWVGWSGINSERLTEHEKTDIMDKMSAKGMYPVHLSRREVEQYYYGFSNKTLWPLFHYFQLLAKYEGSYWNEYVNVNRKFADAVIAQIKPDDIVWIHDYQLLLLPAMIREKYPDIPIGFFLHIPFPVYDIFRLLPWRRELLDGMMGADLIGFHTYDYVSYFLDCLRNILGMEHNLGQVRMGNRAVKIDTFPMGIDYRKYRDSAGLPEVKKEAAKMRAEMKDKKILLSVDRLDYTKGIIQRIESFEYFLDKYPGYREKITLILVVSPSRDGIEDYISIKKVVEEKVGALNGKYGSIGWDPVKYFYRTMSFTEMMALYTVADIGLVTPLRDGMNLVAKEYIAVCEDGHGVLILSEFAGSAKELGEAIQVNPYNYEEVAEAIARALRMSHPEQEMYLQAMHQRLEAYNITQWAEDFLEKLLSIRAQNEFIIKTTLNEAELEDIALKFAASKNALILLDYDGTLVPFNNRPENASPDHALASILKSLASIPGTETVIISGRGRDSVGRWFDGIDINLMAEHGGWFYRKDEKEWRSTAHSSTEWKQEIRPVLERFVLRTPGTFIEEKDFSLVWHYRKTDPELGQIRATELKNSLISLTQNHKIGILEGNMVLEIKDVGISKGQGCRFWISRSKYDFILAAGDDVTDEDMFGVLDDDAITVKVGYDYSRAKYNVANYKDIRGILSRLIKAKKK